ncbi:MAG: hypothetical protein ACETWQ_03480 [Phycisphaerae bacterium]
MKTRKTAANKTVIAIVVITLIVSFVVVRSKLSMRTYRGSAKHLAQQRRVLLLYHTDHEALLKAGRQILSQVEGQYAIRYALNLRVKDNFP